MRSKFFCNTGFLYLFTAVCFLGMAPSQGMCQSLTRLRVEIVDEAGQAIHARCWVDSGGQRLFRPSEPASCTPYERDRSFSCDGRFEMLVPAGDWRVHVEKGKECLAVDRDGTTKVGETTEVRIELRRWIDLPSEGYFSADMHVHFGQDNPQVLRQLALADDVHLVPAFSYWLRGTENSWHAAWPAGVSLESLRADSTHLITRNNIEVERIRRDAVPGGTVGATFLFGLRQPVTAAAYGEHFPSDTAICREAHRHSPDVVLDSDKPSWAETVVQVALGQLDTIQVCHNHYHRMATIPGGWGMIGPLSSGESNAAVGDALFHRTNALYYRFLNCGFRLAVSGGSAIGVMPVPTGYNRVYARVAGELTAEKLWASIKAGRSFATSGPALVLTADGKSMGETVTFTGGQRSRIPVVARLRSAQEIEALEIVQDGLVAKSLDLRGKFSGSAIEEIMQVDLPISKSGWLAARALFRAPDGLLRQAHTSPIYVSVDRRPNVNSEDVQYMLRWIDVLQAQAKIEPSIPTDGHRAAIIAIYAEARAVYQTLLE